jgi:hypothetical protein
VSHAEVERTIELYRAGLPLAAIAAEQHITTGAVSMRLLNAGEPRVRCPGAGPPRREGYLEARGSHRDVVDAGPLLDWLDAWRGRQEANAPEVRWLPRELRPATQGDLLRLAGVSEAAVSRARRSGRMSVANADRILVAAGASLQDLYPDGGEQDAGIAQGAVSGVAGGPAA